MKGTAFKYCSNVWLTTALSSTILWAIGYQLLSNRVERLPIFIPELFLLSIVTLIFSIPAWLLFWLSTWLISIKVSRGYLRLFCLIIAEAECVLTFYIVKHSFTLELDTVWKFMILTCVILGIAVLFYKLPLVSKRT